MIEFIRTEYRLLRTPSRAALVMAAVPTATDGTAPAPAITPMSANCDPPLNMNRLSTQVCQMSRPEATESAPNEMP